MQTGTIPSETSLTTYPNGLRVLCEPRYVRVRRRNPRGRYEYRREIRRDYFATTRNGTLLGRYTTGARGPRPGHFNGRTVRGYRKWLARVREWQA